MHGWWYKTVVLKLSWKMEDQFSDWKSHLYEKMRSDLCFGCGNVKILLKKIFVRKTKWRQYRRSLFQNVSHSQLESDFNKWRWFGKLESVPIEFWQAFMSFWDIFNIIHSSFKQNEVSSDLCFAAYAVTVRQWKSDRTEHLKVEVDKWCEKPAFNLCWCRLTKPR